MLFIGQLASDAKERAAAMNTCPQEKNVINSVIKRKLKNPKLVKFCHLLNIYCSEYAFQDGMIRKNIYME